MRPSPRRLLRLLLALASAVLLAALGGAIGLQPTLAQTGPPGTPTLLSPANGAVDVSPTLTLSWSQPAGAVPGTTVYKVFLSDWQTEQNLPTLTTTNTSLAVPASEALQYGHRYFWSVQACNGTSCSATTGEWDFFVQGPPGAPGHATLVSATPSTTPTFTWNQPSGATAGSTVYLVGLQDDATGAFLPTLPPTTNLDTTAPSSENLVLGHTYDWAVNACNGDLCSGFSDQWTFTTATAPGSPLEASPANGATVTLPTAQNPNSLTLTWTAPAGAIQGTTQYYVSLYDPYGEPQGHFLGDLPLTTNLYAFVPASEGLVPGQQYFWNVQACNGTGACSGYSSSWWSFTSALPALANPSGTGTEWIVNPDFGGSPRSNGGSATGWSAFSGGPPPNYQYWSTALTLDFTSTCVSGGGNCSSFRVGYQLVDNLQNGVDNGSALQVKWYNSQTGAFTQLFYDALPGATPANTWVEAEVQIPNALGASGQLGLVVIGATSDSGVHYPSVAYLDRLGGSSARGVPRVGVTSEPRFPKAISAATGSGVDTVSGAFQLSTTDIAVPGVAGTLSFTRAYSTSTLILPGQTPPLGNRWTHNWQAGLLLYGSGSPVQAVVVTPGGGAYPFVWTGGGWGGGGWSPATGVNASLTSGSGGYTLTTADQRSYTFVAAPGGCGGLCATLGGPGGPTGFYALSQIADRNGNTIAVTTNAGGDVTQAKDTKSGRFLTLNYSGGHIVNVQDNAGRTVWYAYTGNDLTGTTNLLGGTTWFSYDSGGNHWLAGVVDPTNHTVLTNSYDTSGRVSTQQDGGDGSTRGTVTYHYATPSAGVTQVVDQRGKSWSYYANAKLLTTDLVSPTNSISHWDYDADNNVVDAVNNLNGETVTGAFSYDTGGNPLTATDALGYTTTTTYNGQNEPLTITDPLHHVTINTYDGKGNLHTTQNPGGFTTTYAVDPTTGQVTSVTDPLNHTTSYGYTNSYHDRTTVTDALSHTTTTAYDAAGRVTSVTDPLGHSTSYTYTISSGAVDTVTVDPGGINATTTTTLNAAGQKVAVTDPNNHTTSYSYDPRGLLKTVTDALGHQTSYTYDAAWNRTSVTDANGKTTTYAYNDAGQVLTVTDPNGVRQQLYAYDAIGRVSTHTDARGIVSTFSYDLRGAVTQTTFSNGDHALSYSYDADGNRLTMSDASGTTQYVYDALNRPTQVTDGNGNVVQYGYDAAGHRTQILYPASARPLTYAYDAAGRLTSVTD
jgi:YD repeat-containing protein